MRGLEKKDARRAESDAGRAKSVKKPAPNFLKTRKIVFIFKQRIERAAEDLG